ncbi:hypothetical protein, partial [Klebsiella pneumoniae]|uniref:hypothetical protein n=1 Tax=Klebsiella pneumoniae TaxID=573 RepID=UPI002E7A3BA9
FRAANPRLSYREWVEQEALKGDKAALSQMRGFAYSSRKKEKYKQQLLSRSGSTVPLTPSPVMIVMMWP